MTIFASLILSVCFVRSKLLNIQGEGDYLTFLVVLQLFGTTLTLYYLQQILAFYGVCDLFSLTLVISFCKKVSWEMLSPITQNMGRGPEFTGSVLCFVHLSITETDPVYAADECFFRVTQPNLMSLFLTVLVIMAFVYLKGTRVDVPVVSKEKPGQRGTYRIKLIYSSYSSFLLQVLFLLNYNLTEKYTAIAQIKGISQCWYFLSPGTTNRIYRFLGAWKQDESNGELVAISGLCYWLTPPKITSLLQSPFQSLVYIGYILVTCIFATYHSINDEEHEDNPQAMVDDLLGPTHLTMPGKHVDSDEALRNEILRLMSAATILGAVALGIICVACDILNIIGGGQNMLLVMESVFTIYEQWYDEDDKLYRRLGPFGG